MAQMTLAQMWTRILACGLIWFLLVGCQAEATATPRAEPLVPTPLTGVTTTPKSRASPGAEPSRTPTPTRARVFSSSDRQRIGVGFPLGGPSDYDWGGHPPGWYLNWRVQEQPVQPPGVAFAQMVRLRADRFFPTLEEIRATAKANTGALWLIGNEPDVVWQDNATAEQYAESYHTLWIALKDADPTARVAIGGVSQPTALRFDYLDRILAAYEQAYGESMPVDVWNVHAFVLREERGSWGVGIPPGLEADSGELYEIEDHDDLDIFLKQIVDFRLWMRERGLQDKPLIVSEYGVLMPTSYGFPPERVAAFLVDSFDILLVSRDPDIGMPEDDYRLVQAFCWYSNSDTNYPTPNLFDPEDGERTIVGDAFVGYLAAIP